MPNLKLIRERDAQGKVREIYDDIKKSMGWTYVPETFQAIAVNPEKLTTYWTHYKNVMTGGKLDRKTKEIIAIVTSAMNDCGLCVRFHMEAARKSGADEAELTEVMEVMAEVAKGNLIMATLNLGHQDLSRISSEQS